MRILRLHFKNIHSLRGEHTIDFTAEPLSSSGLFAITGPTGAGKSTILDVITLALFNKIPRFAAKGTESISKNDIEKTGSVMTHFTNDAYAEIEYETKKRIYRSTWRISRAKTGNLKDYEMKLATIPENIYEDLKKSEVPAENEKILGLKYDQFIRSILLSQGDFARLLKSDEKERAKLLEDITGSQIYRVIGKTIYEKAKIKEEEIRSLKQQSGMIPLLIESDLILKKDEILAHDQSVQGIQNEIQTIQLQIQKIEKIQSLESKLALSTSALTELEDKKTAFQTKEEQLQKHQQLDLYRGDITLWANEKDRLRSQNQQVEVLKTNQVKAIATLQSAMSQMSVLTHQDIHEINFMGEMKKFENLIIDFDARLGQLSAQGLSVRTRLNQALEKSEGETIDQLKALKNSEDQYKLTSKVLHQFNQQNSSYEGSDVNLKKAMQDLQQEIIILHNQITETKQAEDLLSENLQIAKKEAKLTHHVTEAKLQSAVYSDEIKSLKKNLELLVKQKEHYLMIANLEEYRNQLSEGEPCPLCGSPDHPYAVEKLISQVGQTEILLQNTTSELQQKEIIAEKLNTQLTIAETTINNLTIQKKSNESKIEKLNAKWGKESLPESQALEKEVESKHTMLESLKQEERFRTEKEIFSNLHIILAELTEVSKKYSKLRQDRLAQYKGSNIKDEADAIQNLFVSAKENLQTIQVTIANYSTLITASQDKIAGLDTYLTSIVQKLGYKDVNEALNQILDDQTLQSLLAAHENLKREQTELQTTHENLTVEFNQLKAEYPLVLQTDDLRKKIHDLNLEKDLLNQKTGALQNEIKMHEEQVSKHEKMQKQLMLLENEAAPLLTLNYLIGDATGNRYAKFAQNLSLKHLIHLANKRLIKLTDRYMLVVTDIEEDLKIQDLYQGNTNRSVKTLSGGETFIVSLALALSLADMASKNIKLECLFIDEGFGTLDAETLETALVTLEKLQSESNRTIGIISHVESLKERITTQIKVKKNNTGYSTIEVV